MAVSVVSFSFSMAAQPEPWSLLGAGFPYNCSSISLSNPTRLTTGSSNSTDRNSTVCLLARRTQLSSVQFVGLILPSNSHAVIWTRLHASAISSDILRPGCVTSATFGMACLIVIERKYLSCSSEVTLFRCVSLWEYNGIFFYLVPFHQPISAHAISSHNWH